MQLANNHDVFGIKEQQVGCQAVNSGLFAAAITHRKTGMISAGGDPENDYAAHYKGIHLNYGRKTGSGGPGSQTPGARLF